MILPFSGDSMGVASSENHVMVELLIDGSRIVVSSTRHGNAMSCHFAAEKKALRHMKNAIEEFIQFVFKECQWCEMILANIKKTSVKKLVEKCGFFPVCEINDNTLYVRAR